VSIEQMRAELQQLFQRLEHDRDRLESVLDRLNDGVLLVDRGLTVELANGHARRLLSPGERLGDCGGLDEDSRAQLVRFALDLFTARVPSRLRLEDSARTLVLEGIPPVSGGDTAVIVIVDETERERNERVQREFATNAAHELRTPLASIVTAVEMLQTGAKDEPAVRDAFLDVIARESDRLTRLTRALLVLARAQAGDETPRRQNVRVAPLLGRVAASVAPRDGVEVGVDCSATLAVTADPDLLEQALTSVATNSANQTTSGSISFRGRQDNGSVVIEVADTGSGIRRRDHARIFDRFYRGGRTEDSVGFGLGLSIAREAVHALDGEIELDSEPSVGTTVRITLSPAIVEEEQ
jgi:two-component system sensor histidine kinase VicK